MSDIQQFNIWFDFWKYFLIHNGKLKKFLFTKDPNVDPRQTEGTSNLILNKLLQNISVPNKSWVTLKYKYNI